MTYDETPNGTPTLELSTSEYKDFLDEAVQDRLGVSADEFRRAYLAGELDDSDPDVGLMVVLLAIGQNDDRAAA